MRKFEYALLGALHNRDNISQFITDYLQENQQVKGFEIKNWLNELARKGYINLADNDLYKLSTHEYEDMNLLVSLTHEGIDRWDDLNKKEVPGISIVGDVINSKIGNQSDFNSVNKIEITEVAANTNINLPNVKSIGWFSKFLNWVISNIWTLILGIIGGVLVYFLTKGK